MKQRALHLYLHHANISRVIISKFTSDTRRQCGVRPTEVFTRSLYTNSDLQSGDAVLGTSSPLSCSYTGMLLGRGQNPPQLSRPIVELCRDPNRFEFKLM